MQERTMGTDILGPQTVPALSLSVPSLGGGNAGTRTTGNVNTTSSRSFPNSTILESSAPTPAAALQTTEPLSWEAMPMPSYTSQAQPTREPAVQTGGLGATSSVEKQFSQSNIHGEESTLIWNCALGPDDLRRSSKRNGLNVNRTTTRLGMTRSAGDSVCGNCGGGCVGNCAVDRGEWNWDPYVTPADFPAMLRRGDAISERPSSRTSPRRSSADIKRMISANTAPSATNITGASASSSSGRPRSQQHATGVGRRTKRGTSDHGDIRAHSGDGYGMIEMPTAHEQGATAAPTTHHVSPVRGDSPPWRPPGQAIGARIQGGRQLFMDSRCSSRGSSIERRTNDSASLTHSLTSFRGGASLRGGTQCAATPQQSQRRRGRRSCEAEDAKFSSTVTDRSGALLACDAECVVDDDLQRSLSFPQPPPSPAASSWSRTSLGPTVAGGHRDTWPMLAEGFEPIGPMLRSLEFQVAALFELIDAHARSGSRDCSMAENSVAEVIDRKRDSVMGTFDAVKEALWWQKRRQRQSRPRMHDPSASGGSAKLASAEDVGDAGRNGLRELEALQSQLAQRVAAVAEDVGGISEGSAPPTGRSGLGHSASIGAQYVPGAHSVSKTHTPNTLHEPPSAMSTSNGFAGLPVASAFQTPGPATMTPVQGRVVQSVQDRFLGSAGEEAQAAAAHAEYLAMTAQGHTWRSPSVPPLPPLPTQGYVGVDALDAAARRAAAAAAEAAWAAGAARAAAVTTPQACSEVFTPVPIPPAAPPPWPLPRGQLEAATTAATAWAGTSAQGLQPMEPVASGYVGSVGSENAAVASAVVRPSEGTRLAPLVLTPTAFHYRSPG